MPFYFLDLWGWARIWAWRLGFGPRGLDLVLETGIWASRLEFGPRDWDLRGGTKEEEEKIPHMCESIGHRPLRGRCPKGRKIKFWAKDRVRKRYQKKRKKRAFLFSKSWNGNFKNRIKNTPQDNIHILNFKITLTTTYIQTPSSLLSYLPSSFHSFLPSSFLPSFLPSTFLPTNWPIDYQ